jgi:ribosomal-protein-serine acetyltransferase
MGRVPAVLPERIEGADGLLLRRWTPGDAEALGRAVGESIDHLRPWMGWIAQEPTSIEDRSARLEEWERDWRRAGDVVLGIFLFDRVVGSCGLHRRIASDGLEIGYWIHPSFTRRGLATRAAWLITDAALAQPDISHVEIHHDKANVASAGVPRKLGFQFIGEGRDDPEAPADLGVEWRWRMDKEIWQARRPKAVEARASTGALRLLARASARSGEEPAATTHVASRSD